MRPRLFKTLWHLICRLSPLSSAGTRMLRYLMVSVLNYLLSIRVKYYSYFSLYSIYIQPTDLHTMSKLICLVHCFKAVVGSHIASGWKRPSQRSSWSRPLQWARTLPTKSGCPGPHQVWSWVLQGHPGLS